MSWMQFFKYITYNNSFPEALPNEHQTISDAKYRLTSVSFLMLSSGMMWLQHFTPGRPGLITAHKEH